MDKAIIEILRDIKDNLELYGWLYEEKPDEDEYILVTYFFFGDEDKITYINEIFNGIIYLYKAGHEIRMLVKNPKKIEEVITYIEML